MRKHKLNTKWGFRTVIAVLLVFFFLLSGFSELITIFDKCDISFALTPELIFNGLEGETHYQKFLDWAKIWLQANLRVLDIGGTQDVEVIKEAFRQHERLKKEQTYRDGAECEQVEVTAYFELIEHVGGNIFSIPVSVEKGGEREDYKFLLLTIRDSHGGYPTALCIKERFKELKRSITESMLEKAIEILGNALYSGLSEYGVVDKVRAENENITKVGIFDLVKLSKINGKFLLLFNNPKNGKNMRLWVALPEGGLKTKHILKNEKEITYEIKEDYKWINVIRPGQFGEGGSQRFYDQYGPHGWRFVWKVKDRYVNRLETIKLYEDAYYEHFKKHPEIVKYLVENASDVYDDKESNVDSKFDYKEQETGATHLQDIAIRRVILLRMGLNFKGNKLIQIRGCSEDPVGSALSPGKVPFHKPELIEKPALKGWWKEGSIEDFYQSNKWIQIAESDIPIWARDFEISLQKSPSQLLEISRNFVPQEYHDNGINMEKLISALNDEGDIKINQAKIDQRTAFIFSEKVTFDNGLGILLPKLVKAGIKIAVIARNDHERQLIEKLNNTELAGEKNKVVCADNVMEATSLVKGAVRFYYFKLESDPEESIPDNVDLIDSLVVRQIIKAIGKASGLDIGMIERLHEAARKFAIAA